MGFPLADEEAGFGVEAVLLDEGIELGTGEDSGELLDEGLALVDLGTFLLLLVTLFIDGSPAISVGAHAIGGQETVDLDAEAVDVIFVTRDGTLDAGLGHAVFHLIEVAEEGCRTIGIDGASLAIVVERTVTVLTSGLHLEHSLGCLRAETVDSSIEP